MSPIVIAAVNLKGGTGKTTTAAFAAHVLAESGISVLVVDADPQGSCQRWTDSAGWQIPVVMTPGAHLVTEMTGRGRIVAA
jgi:chromosome partitioning protein